MTAVLPVSGNTAQTAPENRAFYPALDGLRTLAFLLVFLTHYANLPWGWAGVNFFFVLSGFLITGILFDTRDEAHRARNFYIRRTLRIFPLYYGVLLLLLLSLPIFHWFWTWKWLYWAAYLGNFVHFAPEPRGSLLRHVADFQPVGSFHGKPLTLYLGHFWSLCIEEQFYLLWPWVVFAVRDRKKLLWLCGLSLPVGLLLRHTAQVHLPAWMVYQSVLSRFTPLSCDALLFGGFLALLLRGPSRDYVLRAARWLLPLFLLVSLVWLKLHPSWNASGDYNYPSWTETFGFTVLDLLGGLLLLNALQPRTVCYKVLNLRPLRWAGRLSYGAYVYHDIPHTILQQLSTYAHPYEPAALLTSSLVGTYLVAWLSFRFIETPFLNLKDRWTVKAEQPATPLSGAPTFAPTLQA